MPVSIFIADDHPFICQGIRSIFESRAAYSVVGEANDGAAAAEAIERLRPDVAILDILMPGLTGLEIARRIQKERIPTRVIIMSTFADEVYVKEALRAGALGYVTKESSPAHLIEAVEKVCLGEHYLCPTLTDRAVNLYIQRSEEAEHDDYEDLTSREREVLYLAAQGLTNQEVAAQLVISPRTVEVHRANMMRKLGLESPMDIIRYAVRRGLIKL